MRRSSLLLIRWASILAAVGSATAGEVGGQLGGRHEPAESCGEMALRVLCDLKGVRADPDSIRASLGPMPRGGHSLQQIIIAARASGLRLQGVRLEGKEPTPPQPILALLNLSGLGHYVVVRPVAGPPDTVEVIDPNGFSYRINFQDLLNANYWTGAALVPEEDWRGARWAVSSLALIVPLLVGVAMRHLPRSL